MAVVELTKDNFEQEVLASRIPVLIDFWASWSEPCKTQTAIVEKVAEEWKDAVKVCTLNVDEQPLLAMNYQIINLPALVFMKDGIFQERMAGGTDRETIEEHLKNLM